MVRVTAIGEILIDLYPSSKLIGGAPLNFIYHLSKITGVGQIISRIGNDELGQEILEFLNKKDISKKYIQKDQNYPTGIASVMISANKQPSYIISTENAYDFIEITRDMQRLVIKETDCIYFGTLAQRNVVTRKTIQSIFNKGAKYFYDLNIRDNFYNKEIIELSLKATDVLKANLDELKLLNDLFLNEHFEMNKTSEEIMKKFDIGTLAVTLGRDGSALFSNGEHDYYKPDKVDVVDSVGAGDAFASILCIGYLQNWDLKKINKLANNFATAICMIKGALPDNDDVYDFIKKEVGDD